MRRREFITLLGVAAAAQPLMARAQQQPKIARIGLLRQSGLIEGQLDAFIAGMGALGYTEGRNFTVEQRYANGAYDRLGELAADLVRLKVDVIVVDGEAAAEAAKAANGDVPVVLTLGADPVAEGLMTSMAHPGGNLTGLTMGIGFQLAGKRVEILKDLIPGIARLAVLGNPANISNTAFVNDANQAGSSLGLAVRSFDMTGADDLPDAFAAMVEWRADAVLILADGLVASQRDRIAALALDHHLPTSNPAEEFVKVGGLFSYGPNLPDLFRRAATYVDQILRGAKPGDLPVEQPAKFDLVLNLKTAKLLGLTVNRGFLLRADEVIE